MKRILMLLPLLLLAACSPREAPERKAAPAPPAVVKPVPTDLPAGEYVLDPSHASLVFRVNHLGFSNYLGRFTDFDVTLQLDPANPAASRVEAVIDPRSLRVENPPAGFEDELRGPNWLDAGRFGQITFRSTKVELTGPRTARITGDLGLHGVTRPVTLEAVFNGGYTGHPMDPNARVGFSAKGAFDRSDFGVAYGVPAEGSTMGVSDRVEVQIEAELLKPHAKPATAG